MGKKKNVRKFTVITGVMLTAFFTMGMKEGETLKPDILYDFENVSDGVLYDTAGENAVNLSKNADTVYLAFRDSNVCFLNGKSSYLKLPEGIFDGRDEFTVSFDVCSLMGEENFFTFAIGQDSNKYLFLRARGSQFRAAITESSYTSEQDVVASGSFKNVWTNVTMVVTKDYMKLYIDGKLKDTENNINISLSDFGTGLKAYIGKSFYSGDSYFKGYIDNFSIFYRTLEESEVAEMCNTVPDTFEEIRLSDFSLVTYKVNEETKHIDVYVSVSNGYDSENTVINLKEGNTGRIYHTVLKEETALKLDNGDEWTIKAVKCANPVLAGQYADPAIAAFDGRYYLYTTTDGFSGWSGTVFHCFSSENLTEWEDEGIILDVKSSDVSWAVGSAWAPTITEKEGKYYFYFCAKEADGVSAIGVAVADSPEGPYTATDRPVMTMTMCRESGVSMGQTIDPSIFKEDNGDYYLVFGNGNAAVVKLNEDMVSVDLSTIKNIRGLYDFREALEIIKRDGVYHYTWSCDDTGSENYHINYGISNTLYGPVEFKYTILEKDTESDILGTGHHSTLHIDETDEYYIAYHRFFTPVGFYKDGLGFHRETCIDKLEFDEETGLISKVTPTLEGVAPVSADVMLKYSEADKDLANGEKDDDNFRKEDGIKVVKKAAIVVAALCAVAAVVAYVKKRK